MTAFKFPQFLAVIEAFEATNPAKHKVYMLTCRVTGESFIGCSFRLYSTITDVRVAALSGKSRNILSKTIAQYGLESFDLKILDADDDREYVVHTLVPSYISLHNTFRNGLNETHGGKGPNGYKVSPQVKKILRLNAIRNNFTPPTHWDCRWINNGSINKILKNGQPLPSGFVIGRLVNSQRKAA